MIDCGKKPDGHPTIGRECAACKVAFVVGDRTALVTIGPGSDEPSRKRALCGRPYNAVSFEVHWACATGEVDE